MLCSLTLIVECQSFCDGSLPRVLTTLRVLTTMSSSLVLSNSSSRSFGRPLGVFVQQTLAKWFFSHICSILSQSQDISVVVCVFLRSCRTAAVSFQFVGLQCEGSLSFCGVAVDQGLCHLCLLLWRPEISSKLQWPCLPCMSMASLTVRLACFKRCLRVSSLRTPWHIQCDRESGSPIGFQIHNSLLCCADLVARFCC